MRYLRLYSENGRSRFEERELPLGTVSTVEAMSHECRFVHAQFNETKSGHQYEWHNAPRRQFVVTLQGEIEIEVEGGEKKRQKAGDVLLAEDLTGKGHRTKVVSTEPWRCVYLPLVNQADSCG